MRILVIEPHAEVRALLGHVVARLGHEPIYLAAGPDDALPADHVDVLLIEPADPGALVAAESLRRLDPKLPIVCASIHPESESAERLGPLAYLVKPFGLDELRQALVVAAAASAGVPA